MDTDNRKQSQVSRALWIGMGLVFLLAFGIHGLSTLNWGVGVSHDSIFYLSSANNFLEGGGISNTGGGGVLKPLIHFPPLYPLSLSLIGLILGDVNQAANWTASFFFAFNAALTFWLIFLGTKSMRVAILGAVVFISSPIVLDVHFEAMSEPIFLAFCFLSLGTLAMFHRTDRNLFFLLAAVFSAGAYLTRYVGITVVVTGMLTILVYFPGTLRRKIQKASIFGLIGFGPIIAWYIRNFMLTGSFANRVFAIHLMTKEKINEGLLTISQWILPESYPFVLGLGIVVVLCIFILIGFILRYTSHNSGKLKAAPPDRNLLSEILLLYAGIYVSFLVISLSFFDSSTKLLDRIMMPLYFSMLVLVFLNVHRIIKSSRKKQRSAFLTTSLLLSILIIGFYSFRSWDLVQSIRENGRGFSSAAWHRSEIVASIRTLGTEATVYTNEAAAIYYLTGIGAHSIPEKYDPVKAQVRDNFDTIMEKMRQRLTLPDSALAIFHQGYLRVGMPTLEEMSAGLVLVKESRDGVIFVDPNYVSDWIDE